jgi:hypothetical protein
VKRLVARPLMVIGHVSTKMVDGDFVTAGSMFDPKDVYK